MAAALKLPLEAVRERPAGEWRAKKIVLHEPLNAEHGEPNRSAEDAHRKHWPASDAIRELADERGKDELQQRINAHDPRELIRVCVDVPFCKKRQSRDDDAEADHINEQRQEDEAERCAAIFSRRSFHSRADESGHVR